MMRSTLVRWAPAAASSLHLLLVRLRSGGSQHAHLARGRERVGMLDDGRETVGRQHAQRLERQHIRQLDLVTDKPQRRGQHVDEAPHISHCRDEVTHAAVEEIVEMLTVKLVLVELPHHPAEIASEQIGQRLVTHWRQHLYHLDDFLQVFAPALGIVRSQRRLDAWAVKRQQVDKIRKVTHQTHEAHDIDDLCGAQPVDVVHHDQNGLVEFGQTHPQIPRADTRAPALALETLPGLGSDLTSRAKQLAYPRKVLKRRDHSTVGLKRQGHTRELFNAGLAQLAAQFLEEVLDELLGPGEQPRVEVNNHCFAPPDQLRLD